MTKKQIHEVIFKRGDGKEIVVHANFNEEGARRYFDASPHQHELRSREVEMLEPLTGTYHLPEDTRRSIAHWLVYNGGAGFEQLEAYNEELKEGLFQHWFEREDVDYDEDAYHPTTRDLSYITELVSKAQVVVVLPEHVDESNLDDWYEDGTRMEEAEMPAPRELTYEERDNPDRDVVWRSQRVHVGTMLENVVTFTFHDDNWWVTLESAEGETLYTRSDFSMLAEYHFPLIEVVD